MKRVYRSFVAILCLVALLVTATFTAFAHSGRTDSSGGHKDKKNKSGLGPYHYHCGGYPAHLHTDGWCRFTDIFPSSVSIKAGKKTLGIGESTTISASVSPSNACDTDVYWENSNPDVIRLSGDTITAVGYGQASLTAKTFNGKHRTMTIIVKEIKPEKVTLSGLPEKGTTTYIKDSFDLTATITPENVDNPSIEWTTSDETIATVNNYGKVHLLAAGKVTISAIASNGVTGKYTFNVKEKVVEKIEIPTEDFTLKLGEKQTLEAVITPADATYPEVTWSSSDPSIVEVSASGSITAVNCGTATITATSTNGLSDSVNVEVQEIKAERIAINGAVSLTLGNSAGYSVVFYPENTTVQDFEWLISDESIATIDENGNLTTLRDGKITLTAHQKDVDASIDIEIKPIPVDSIIISTENDFSTVDVDETLAFSAVVSPSNATYPAITWSVDNPELATIDENGVVTGLARGTVIVTATSEDGCSASFELVVTGLTDLLLGLGVIGGAAGAVGTGAVVVTKKSIKATKKIIKKISEKSSGIK